jgi:hypothetical protein
MTDERVSIPTWAFEAILAKTGGTAKVDKDGVRYFAYWTSAGRVIVYDRVDYDELPRA